MKREGQMTGTTSPKTLTPSPSPGCRARVASDSPPVAERVVDAPERLLTRKELAGYLQVCLRTVDSMIGRKEILPVRVGKRLVRFRLEDVLQKLKGD